MIKQERLGDLIQERVVFTPASNGWHSLKCPVCSDYKTRGGFKFDGDTIIYSCFNCGYKTVYEEFTGKLSRKFRKLLNDCGIDDPEISTVVNTAFFSKKEAEPTISLKSLTEVNTHTPEIQLPEKSFKLGHHEFIEHQARLVEYLLNRKVDLDKYPFYFSLDDRFINSVIIPFYRQGKLIYWQARDISGGQKRYDNAHVSKDAVLFNMDRLNAFSPAPLFITEGVFDAMMVDGVALIGSTLSEAKLKLLSESRRRKVFVIDKDKNGALLANKVLDHGWEIAFSPAGSGDINNSVQRFGLSWTTLELMKSIPRGRDAARLAINLNCR